MQKTTNYQLCQWDGEDRILRTDFNEDNAKIDAALKAHANSIATINSALSGTASGGTVTTLSAKLNTEIQNRKDADTAEANARAQADNTEKAAREAADEAEAQAREQAISAEAAARTAALALKGNVQAEIKTYTGTGSDSVSLTFSKRPLLFYIGGTSYCSGFGIRGSTNLWVHNGNLADRYSGSWSGNTYTFSEGSGNDLNSKNETYTVVALYAADE